MIYLNTADSESRDSISARVQLLTSFIESPSRCPWDVLLEPTELQRKILNRLLGIFCSRLRVMAPDRTNTSRLMLDEYLHLPQQP